MSFTVKLSVKRFFFDRAVVKSAVNAATRRALSKAGAFVRRRARSSLRRRKGVSQPGSPPSVHTADSVATLKNILFAFEFGNQSVIVGPVGLNQVTIVGGRAQALPALLEFGGIATIHEVSSNRGKTWRRRDLRRNPRPWEMYRRRQAVYKPRPFMLPALRAEAPNFPDLWANSVRAA